MFVLGRFFLILAFLSATTPADDQIDSLSFSVIPHDVVVNSLIPSMPYYDVLALALTCSVLKEAVFTKAFETVVPGAKEGPRFWPLKFLFESMLQYKEEWSRIEGQLSDEKDDLELARKGFEARLQGFRGLVCRYLEHLEGFPWMPIDRISLHAMREAYHLRTLILPCALNIAIPAFSIMRQMLQEGNYLKPSSSHMGALEYKGLPSILGALVHLKEAGRLPSIIFDTKQRHYDANIERLFKANGGPCEIDGSDLQGPFMVAALIVADVEELLALLQKLSSSPELMHFRSITSLFLVIKQQRFENLRYILPALHEWPEVVFDTLLLHLCLSDFHTEDILRIVCGDDRVDQILGLIHGTSAVPSPSALDEYVLPLLFTLVKKPDDAFEKRLALYFKELAVELPPKCLMMAYLQGYSVDFLRRVWNIEAVAGSDEWAEALQLSRAMSTTLSNTTFLYICSDLPINNRTFLLEDGAPNADELALIRDLTKQIQMRDRDYFEFTKAFPDRFVSALLDSSPLSATNDLSPFTLMAWQARRIETVKKVAQIFGAQTLSRIYASYPPILHSEIDALLTC